MTGPGPLRVGANALPDTVGWQCPAVDAAVNHLRDSGRGQIHAACGTGKTITAAHIATRLCPTGRIVVVACPTVALVGQALAVLSPTATATLAVCGDDAVADTAVHPQDLPTTVATDVDTITAWLRTAAAGVRLIVTTHRSAQLLGQALLQAGETADILVVDEAHHSAGHDGKQLAGLHTDHTFPARRRLYLTATPRVDDTDDDNALSMDDPEVFGPVLYRYTFAQAIADGWLDDYRIAVVGVSRAEILPLLRDLTAPPGLRTGGDGPLRTAMVAAALSRAAAEFDLRRTIVYAPRIAASRALVAALAPIAAALHDPQQPMPKLTCHHVDGRHNAAQRREFLTDLAHPPDDGWTVLSNVRCLGEGIDVPAIDSVAFSHPKSSVTEVIQGVGRALRRNRDGTGVATILIPVLVDDDAELSAQADADGYATVWQVVRALRAHDDALAAALDLQRRGMATTSATALPDKIVVRLPDGYDIDNYLRHLTVRLVTATTSPWWEGYGAAAQYHAEHGHLFVHVDHVTSTGYRLGSWIHHQRKARRRGQLPAARIRALDTLGMLWDPRGARWETGLLHAAQYRAREGHLRVPPDYVTDSGYRLGQWIRLQRKKFNAGQLDADRAAALQRLGIEWDPYQAMWERGISHAIAYHARTGHLRVPAHYVDADGYRLGQFIVAQRMLHQRGTVAADRINALNLLGMKWSRSFAESFADGLTHAREYHRLHQTLHMAKATTSPDGYPIGAWLVRQRTKLRAGTLAEAAEAALDAISPTWRD
ncbi:DEAD/DEAH box helicase [Paractinoplanes toevensis]|uniref:Helicase n=1 Tax=Paractinoplanes toevensis TaxID=571911 RepID=A0A919VZG4_9ACTN|nr:DEAD/DEAH box helicase [Actinoplanes toevensis]GIM90107.1 hypothetical protein Ato02nite_019000 [Actinoplanes toevensis]